MTQHLKGWVVFTEDDDGAGRLVKITTPRGTKSLIALPTREANQLVEAMKEAGAAEPTGKGTPS